jgi:hypothetical protein
MSGLPPWMLRWLRQPSQELNHLPMKSADEHIAEIFVRYTETHPTMPPDPFCDGIKAINFSGVDFDSQYEITGRSYYDPHVVSKKLMASIIKSAAMRQGKKHSWLTREKCRIKATGRFTGENRFNRFMP